MSDTESEEEATFTFTKREWLNLKNNLFLLNKKLDSIINNESPQFSSVPQLLTRTQSMSSVSSITSLSSNGAPDSVRLLELSNRQVELFKESVSVEKLQILLTDESLFLRILETTFSEWSNLR